MKRETIERLAIGFFWVALGVLILLGVIPLHRKGAPPDLSEGRLYHYFKVLAGAGFIVTGILYVTWRRLRTYLDRQADEIDQVKGKYRWFGRYTIWRFFRWR